MKSVLAFAPNPPVYTWVDPGNDVPWLVRPFYITDDLRVIHNWLSDVNSFTNQAFNRDEHALINHYKKRLRSETEQSFVIQRKKLVVGQVDLVPVTGSPIALVHPIDVEGFALYYVFPGDRSHEYCRYSLDAFIQLTFNRCPGYSMFVEIPLDQRAIFRIATGLGFHQVNEYWHQQKAVGLFRAKL